MPSASHSVSALQESGWEYEYDDSTTEDHYIIVELPRTSNIQTLGEGAKSTQERAPWEEPVTKKRAINKKRKAQAKDIALQPIAVENGGQPLEAIEATPEETVAAPQPQVLTSQPIIDQQTAKDSKKDKLQVLGFHGDDPLLSVDGDLYSCKWTQALGTDMLFTQRTEDVEPAAHAGVLRTLPAWDLLGFGAARLKASRATLTKRKTMDPPSFITTDPDKAPVSRQSRVNQADFLTKLNALRVKMGQMETAPPPVQPTFIADDHPIPTLPDQLPLVIAEPVGEKHSAAGATQAIDSQLAQTVAPDLQIQEVEMTD